MGGLGLSPRALAVLRALLLVLAVSLLLLVLQASRPAAADTPPPISGDWVISDSTSYSSPLAIRGDIIIKSNGSLTLNNANIVFNCLSRGEFGIRVDGRLNATRTAFSASNPAFPFTFKINTGATADLDHCIITGAGTFSAVMDTWGIYIHSTSTNITFCTITQGNVGLLVHNDIAPNIIGNNISGNSDRGIWCKFSSPLISNNLIANNKYGIYIENDSWPTLLNNQLQNNLKEAVFMGNDSFADWSINQPVTWVNATVLLRGNLTVEPGGTLTMQGCDLQPASTPEFRKGVLVRAGGRLRILGGSSLRAPPDGAAYSFRVEEGADLTIADSGVHDAGYDAHSPALMGINIASSANISGADLTGNGYSLVLENATVTVANSTFGGGLGDIWMANSALRLMNVTYQPSKVVNALVDNVLEVGWYLSVGVLWQNRHGVAGATLTVKDSAQQALYDGPLGPDGWLRWMPVLQFRLTNGVPADLGNITLLAKKAGLGDLGRTLQVSANREEEMVFIDPSPPSVAILSPAASFGTNRTWVLLIGNSSDDIGLERVELKLDDSLRWTPLTLGDWSFNLTNLSQGQHRVEVRAVDFAGLTSAANLTFLVDTEPPRLELTDPLEPVPPVNHTGILFEGETDPGSDLTVDGITVPVSANGDFSAVIDFAEGVHDVRIVAKDRGGNTAVLVRRITVDITPPQILVHSPANRSRTRLSELQLVGRVEPGAKFQVNGRTVELDREGNFNTTIQLSGGTETFELYAEDRTGNSNSTTWVLERELEATAGQAFLERYGTLLAAAALLLVLVIVAAALLALSRRRRKRPEPPRPPVRPAEEIPVAEATPVGSVDEMLYGKK